MSLFNITLTPEQKKIARAWVKALRSKRYKQGKGALRSRDGKNSPLTYCCLGVLANVCGVKWAGHDRDGCLLYAPNGNVDKFGNHDHGYLGTALLKKTGLTDTYQKLLGRLNDTSNDFDMIANEIEIELLGKKAK